MLGRLDCFTNGHAFHGQTRTSNPLQAVALASQQRHWSLSTTPRAWTRKERTLSSQSYSQTSPSPAWPRSGSAAPCSHRRTDRAKSTVPASNLRPQRPQLADHLSGNCAIIHPAHRRDFTSVARLAAIHPFRLDPVSRAGRCIRTRLSASCRKENVLAA